MLTKQIDIIFKVTVRRCKNPNLVKISAFWKIGQVMLKETQDFWMTDNKK